MIKSFFIGISLITITLGLAIFFYVSREQPKRLQNCTLQHMGVIMDGNRRWAKRSGMPSWFGHKKGVDPVKTVISFCLKHKIPYLTLYAFSLENFKRSHDELSYLFDVLAKEISDTELERLYKHGVRIKFVGDEQSYPAQLKDLIKQAEEKTANCTNLTLSILFCYGGRQEIVQASRKLARAVQAGTITPEKIDEELFTQALWTNHMPDPQLVIRTGNAHRLSNFLTFQSAYSELYFLDCYWPEVTEEHLIDAVLYFEQCKRNFGA